MAQGKTTLQSKLDNCREAERNYYLAKVEYIYDTYDRAKEFNRDE